MPKRYTPVFFEQGRVLVWVKVGIRKQDRIAMYKRLPPQGRAILSLPAKHDFITLMDMQSIEGQGGQRLEGENRRGG